MLTSILSILRFEIDFHRRQYLFYILSGVFFPPKPHLR